MKPNEMRAMAHAGMAASLFIALATIAAELSPAFKTFLATTFGHHWVGKGVLALLIFGAIYYLQKDRVSSGKIDLFHLARRVAFVAILCGVAIFVFYLWEVIKG